MIKKSDGILTQLTKDHSIIQHMIENGELSQEEKEQMPDICKRVIDGVKAFATIGPDRAMNTVNTRPKNI